MPSDCPSVTRVLRAQGYYALAPPGVARAVQHAMDRGTLVHELCADGADSHQAPESVRGYVAAFVRARRELEIEPIVWEALLESQRLGYRGKPDLVGWWRGRRSVVDLKTGERTDPTTVIQIAAYAWLAADVLQVEIAHAAALQLRAAGTYRWHLYTAGELACGREQWAAALRTYLWRQEHGRLPSRGPRDARPPWEGEPTPWDSAEVDDA